MIGIFSEKADGILLNLINIIIYKRSPVQNNGQGFLFFNITGISGDSYAYVGGISGLEGKDTLYKNNRDGIIIYRPC